jgi:hypothetical protein
VTLTARVVRRHAMATVIAELPLSTARRWQEQLNEPGSGELVLHHDDPATHTILAGDVIQFLIDDVVRFAFIVRNIAADTIAATPDGQAAVYSGPGLLAALDDALVYPSRGLAAHPVEENRTFSWTAPDYNDAAWVGALQSFGAVNSEGPPPFWPDGPSWDEWRGRWPDNFTELVWAAPATTFLAPGGHCYWRKTFDMPTASRVRLTMVCDDRADIYLDGGLILEGKQSGGGPSDITAVDIDEIDDGVHTLAAFTENSESGSVIIDGEEFNPAALACSLAILDPFGQVGATVVHTDTSWHLLAYPATPPGMTPGEAILHVIAEAQARGCLPDFTCAFTATADADGVTWPVVGDISTKVGTDILSFLREMTETYIDVAVDPATHQLLAWQRDGRGADTPVTLQAPTDTGDPWSGNLAALTHRYTA